MGFEDQAEMLRKLMFDEKEKPAYDKDDLSAFDVPSDRGNIARQEEMCALLRRQVELLELLCKNQAIALAKVMGDRAAQATPSMDKPLNPARQRPSNE